MASVDLRPDLTIDDTVLADFASRNGIRRLAAFGSVLRSDFTDTSDVDLLVEFEPDRTPGLLRVAAMELELGGLLHRSVELRTYDDLSRHFRDEVRDTAVELYAA